MKQVTIKNFIWDFTFLTAAQTLCIGRHGLAFSTKTTIQISLSFFFSLLCLHSWQTDFSVSILTVTYFWFKVVWLEAVTQRCSTKNVFLEILQNLQENTCVRVSFLLNLQAWGLQLYLKWGCGTDVFLWCFCKISKNTFFTEHLQATASAWF